MNAVATMTPEPKYLAMKKGQSGILTPLLRRAQTGKTVPSNDPTRMTKIAETLRPSMPLYSLPVSQALASASAMAEVEKYAYRSESLGAVKSLTQRRNDPRGASDF